MNPKESPETERLTDLLDALSDVSQFDEKDERQAPIVAEGLTHINETVGAFQELFARLKADGLTDEQRLDLLWDIGEELRHMDHHIHDMAYFDSQINDEEGETLDS